MGKKPEHVQEAQDIGDGFWELQRFMQLPKNASATRQRQALEGDKHWIEIRAGEIADSIRRLQDKIDPL